MTDPIADMIIRIKNAFLASHREVALPHSKIKASIAQILEKGGYIEAVEIKDSLPQKTIVLKLKYIGKVPSITEVKRISKPGRRIYATARQIPRALGGYGLTIISSSQGILTDVEARKKNIGGEVICQIW